MNTIFKKSLIGSITISTPFIYGYFNEKNKNKEIKDIILKDDVSSKTVLSVSKKVKDTWNTPTINVYNNEKKWLNILKDTDIIAKPIHFDDKHKILTTEYVGNKINKNNIPKDWEKQKEHILTTLKNHNCRHNDIKPDEILVQNNKIKFIDFGWAHDLDKSNPSDWPKCLGDKFKCNLPNKDYDDECSFDKVIKHILDDR
jgi:hypothetical protein